jgi:hypothetical protein
VVDLYDPRRLLYLAVVEVSMDERNLSMPAREVSVGRRILSIP